MMLTPKQLPEGLFCRNQVNNNHDSRTYYIIYKIYKIAFFAIYIYVL